MMETHAADPSPMTAAERTPVREIMTFRPITVRPELELDMLVELLLERGLSRVPVVDDAGCLLGMVSKTDVVVDYQQRGDTEVSQVGAGFGGHVHLASSTVRDVMTPMPVAILETTSIGEAARRMLVEDVHAFPVIRADGTVSGIVSTTDLIAWIAGD